MKKISIVIGVCLVLLVGTTGLSMAVDTNTRTTTKDGNRVLVLEEFETEDRESLTARANLTLPHSLLYDTQYDANYSTEESGNINSLSLTVSNSSGEVETFEDDLPTEGSWDLNYSAGDYDANFTMSTTSGSTVYMNVTFSMGSFEETFDIVSNLIQAIIPVMIILAIITTIIKVFTDMNSGW